MPLVSDGLPDFLEFLKLLVSGDGTSFSTNVSMKELEEKEEKQERERENAWI